MLKQKLYNFQKHATSKELQISGYMQEEKSKSILKQAQNINWKFKLKPRR